MGIPGLPALIKSITKDSALQLHDFSDFAGMTIAIDTSILVHNVGIGVRKSGRDMTNKEGGLTSHLQGIFYKILKFLENDMVPIFVFDGIPSELKNREIEKRKECKNIASEKLSSLTDEEYIACFQKTFSPSQNDYLELQIMLDLMGIPYVVAPEEADPVLAWLATRKDENGRKFVKGVCTDDSDILVLGAPYIFKDMPKAMGKKGKVTVISLKRTLEKMNLNMDQFVDMCVLMGCDYCERIPKIGPTTSYKLIVAKKNLKGAIDYLKKDGKDIDMENVECMIKAIHYFKTAVDNLDSNDNFTLMEDNIKLRKFQYDELYNFMCVKHNFDAIKIETMIKRLAMYYEKMGVDRPNNSKVHTIVNKLMEGYEFLSTESESE